MHTIVKNLLGDIIRLDYGIIYTKFSVILVTAGIFCSDLCRYKLGQELAQNLLEQVFKLNRMILSLFLFSSTDWEFSVCLSNTDPHLLHDSCVLPNALMAKLFPGQ